MVKRRGNPDSSPSLKPEQAIPILENHIDLANAQLRAERYDSPNRTEWMHTGDAALSAAFGRADNAVSGFHAAQCGSYEPYDTDETLREQANQQLDGMLSVLRSGVQRLRWTLPDPKQVFLPSGSQHDAYVQIRAVIQMATTEILIVDTYLDQTLWPLLTNLPSTCRVRLLGENLKGDFILEARKFAAQHKTSIEIRTTTKYHDRFIVLDGKRCFHLGASIKDAGNKGFALSEFERPQLITAILIDLVSVWAAATRVVI